MRRVASVLSALVVALAAACSPDRSTNTPDSALPESSARPRANVEVPACQNLTPTQITALIVATFETGSPDVNSALGKWSNIQKQQADGNTALVKEKTIDLVGFMTDKQREGKLAADPTTAQRLSDLVLALGCYAGVELYLPPGATGIVLVPGHLPVVITTPNGQAGASIEANSVDQASLFTINPSTDTLNTDLDKYPVDYDFSLYPVNTFNKPITVGVCATTPDQATLDRLVLGHNIDQTGFELLPKRSVDFLSCVASQSAAAPSVVDRVLSAVLPKKLYAAAFFGVGGVGGSVIELSPIGPVDPQVNVIKNTAGTDAPIGSLVTPTPSVTLQTPNKLKKLGGIQVQFTTDGLEIAPASIASLGGSGIATSTVWRLGNTAGQVYTATATPQIGGAVAVPGVQFFPLTQTFSATATAPTQLVITNAPASGSQFLAGVTHSPATRVEARDAAGRLAEGFAGIVSMQATSGATVQPIATGASVTAAGGVALFTGLSITKTGTFLMTPQASFGAGALGASGAYSVEITPAAAATITAITAPLPLNSAVNTMYPITVEVRDGFGNLRPNTTVYFTPTPNPTGAPPVEVTTGSTGRATFNWTVSFGTNTLFASLDATPTEGRFVEFTTEVVLSNSVSLTCSARGNRQSITTTAARLTSAPRSGSTVRPVSGVQFYFSITGAASSVISYPIGVTARFTDAATGVTQERTTSASVPLRGSASQDLAGRFAFTPAFTPRANTPVVFTFTKPNTDREIRVNVGATCAPGDNKCRNNCAAKTITNSPGFDLFTTPVTNEAFKIDLFTNG